MLLLGAAVSLCYIPGLTGAFIATQWPLLSAYFAVEIIWPLVWRFFKNAPAPRSGPVTAFHWLGVLFVGYAAVRTLYAPIFEDSICGLWMLCIVAASFWLGSTLTSMRQLYAGLWIGGFVSSCVAVLQANDNYVVPYDTATPAGLYVNSVSQGVILSLLVVALVSERMLWRAAMLVPGILLSGSRGAWLALAVGLLATYTRRKSVFVALVGVAGALFVVHVVYGSGGAVWASDKERLDIWYLAANNFTLWGYGPGSFFSWLLWREQGSFYPEYAHNDALQLIFEYGAVAAIPIGIGCFVLTRERSAEWPVIVAFITAGCYSMPLAIPAAAFIGCVAAGRVVRDWALDGPDVYDGRYSIVQW